MIFQGTIRETSSLSGQDTQRMYSLMTAHYDNVKEQKFLGDLAEKDGVLVLSDEHGSIQGFTTFLLIETHFQSDPIYALFSGDTIIAREYWGQRELFRGFGRLFAQFLHEQKKPLYVFFSRTQPGLQGRR